MTSCILTIIKDEQLYLDEWIQYHLNLGIDHIFIFEDIDSTSHLSITSNYSQVTLNSINVALDNLAQQEAKLLKQTKKYSSHYLYLKNLLIYMQKYHSNYDWCFTLDIDEFLTLNNNGSVNDILSLYNDYDAVILRWKCYNANGLIQKPDYNNYTTPEIFTKEAITMLADKPSCLCKTCYNIKKYRPDFFGTPHSPKDTCNYCNTDFIKSDIIPSYTNMYIRHYITKSWEEYIWKLKVRGFMWGGRRNIDFFFKINPELLPWKETLIARTQDKVLVILPFCGGRAQGNEIRIALTSWRKFCQFNYHFVVIGEFSEDLVKEFDWVEFIYEPRIQPQPNQYNPHLDIQHKMEVAYNRFRDKYMGLIYTCDDFYAIKPFTIEDIITIYYHQLSFEGVERLPTSYWKHDKWKTRQLMDKENFPHINYTAHFPCFFGFNRLKMLWDKYDMRHESYVPEDVYFNSFEHEEPISDEEIRFGIWNQERFSRINEAIENPKTKFIFNSVEGWSKALEEKLWDIINN